MKIKIGGDKGMELHSVGPLLERGIEAKAREEIEKIVLETLYREKPELRKFVDEIVGEITVRASQEANDETGAMYILDKELERFTHEVIERTKAIISL